MEGGDTDTETATQEDLRLMWQFVLGDMIEWPNMNQQATLLLQKDSKAQEIWTDLVKDFDAFSNSANQAHLNMEKEAESQWEKFRMFRNVGSDHEKWREEWMATANGLFSELYARLLTDQYITNNEETIREALKDEAKHRAEKEEGTEIEPLRLWTTMRKVTTSKNGSKLAKEMIRATPTPLLRVRLRDSVKADSLKTIMSE